ncbi:MAG: carboxypeptidase-like regulatory domain-containing protein, partial [Odoribacter sp.]|nr:carboxypeptidase-like regulatory domain-containing protein [Odoribacter sp.]
MLNTQVVLGEVQGEKARTSSVVSEPQVPQTRKVRGKVLDAKTNEPLVGVTIAIRGKNLPVMGSATDRNGQFSIDVPEVVTELAFSFIGYKAQTLPVDVQHEMVVRLEEEAVSMEEVVVTGYQKIDRRRSTSAISTVKATDVLVPGMTSIDQALEGRIPELMFLANSGEVG